MNKNILLTALMLGVSLLQGCSTPKSLVAIGGSRADGIVTMAYNAKVQKIPPQVIAEGVGTATQRCKAWGYTGADPFQESVKTCANWKGDRCLAWRITVDYQCTGQISASK